MNYEQLKDKYREAIKLNPNDTYIRIKLGFLLYDLGRDKEAEKEFRKVIEKYRDDDEARRDLGLLLYYSRCYGELKKELKEAEKVGGGLK